MAHTTSLAFPNMFDVSKNSVSVYEDNQAIVNRCRLLILTEPTEVYNSPEFGVGLKRHLFKYNTENEKRIIQDRITAQIDQYEPYVSANEIQFADGLLFTGEAEEEANYNKLDMTIGLRTVYGDEISINMDED